MKYADVKVGESFYVKVSEKARYKPALRILPERKVVAVSPTTFTLSDGRVISKNTGMYVDREGRFQFLASPKKETIERINGEFYRATLQNKLDNFNLSPQGVEYASTEVLEKVLEKLKEVEVLLENANV